MASTLVSVCQCSLSPQTRIVCAFMIISLASFYVVILTPNFKCSCNRPPLFGSIRQPLLSLRALRSTLPPIYLIPIATCGDGLIRLLCHGVIWNNPVRATMPVLSHLVSFSLVALSRGAKFTLQLHRLVHPNEASTRRVEVATLPHRTIPSRGTIRQGTYDHEHYRHWRLWI